MCFSNFHNRFGSIQVFMNFGVYYQDLGDSKKDDNDKQLNNTLDTIEVKHIMNPQLHSLIYKMNSLCLVLQFWVNTEMCKSTLQF